MALCCLSWHVPRAALGLPFFRPAGYGGAAVRLWARSGSQGQAPAAAAAAKRELLKRADEFRTKQEAMWEMMDREAAAGGKRQNSLLEAESFAAQRSLLSGELEALRNKTIQAIERLAELNPTPEPCRGWRGFGGGRPEDCMLNGTWKLLFTDAADATFRKGKRGAATTFQEIDAAGGWFVNCVDFSDPNSKLKGFRVYVEGEALSAKEIQLTFRKVRLLRRSRFPRLFGQITIPLPGSKLLRRISNFFAWLTGRGEGANRSRRGAGFTLLYLDDEVRVHRTFDGLYFVQRRLT